MVVWIAHGYWRIANAVSSEATNRQQRIQLRVGMKSRHRKGTVIDIAGSLSLASLTRPLERRAF
jgi:hypothetical protein